MNTTRIKSAFVALAAAMIVVSAMPMAVAQQTSRGMAVVYPVVYSRDSGGETSRRTGVRSVEEVLQKAGGSVRF